MLKFNFIYELKLLLRSRWIQLLSLVLLILFGIATNNGLKRVEKQKSDIALAKAEVQENDENMMKVLDSLERGLFVNFTPWKLPKYPMSVANYSPRVAAMPVNDFAMVSTGQSDMFINYVKPKATHDGLFVKFTEMTSPVQLLFGSFDLAFVIIYLLPLLIIAFSYNVLSSEKESGTFRLLASQPINIRSWVLQKLVLRFFWLSVLVITALTLVLFVLGLNPFSHTGTYLVLLIIVLAYMLFWFALAFLINLWISSSAKNAVLLLGLWVVFVLLIPSVLNQLGATIYPMPPRTLMINKMRTLQADATKRQDEILDNFLRDHPEYALNDSTQRRTFWHTYLVSQNLIRSELLPVINTYEEQLRQQQDWISRFKWISPAIVARESLNQIAGTSSRDYNTFRKQVMDFSQKWREYFVPFVFNNQDLSKTDYVNLPDFEYLQEREHEPTTLFLFFMIPIGLFGLGFLASKNMKVLES